MRNGHQEKEKLAVSVGIALTAGMFSILPVAYGAPTGGSVKVGGADISDTLNITSTTKNNVIDWQDFSVKQGETLTFDKGAKTNNYLNIVRGANTSRIDGTIKGGNEVYIVNPNGVILGKGATVDVGSFYASTRYISPTDAKAINQDTNTAEYIKDTVLKSTDKTVASDIVNLGNINASKVLVEGQNIRFLDSNNVNSTDVTLKANGYIHIGNSTGTNATGYTGTTLNGGTKDIDYYQTISSMSDVTDMSQNYMLSDNITGGSGVDGEYKGKFDGMGYTITGMTSTVGGLFAKTDGATIENVGVVNSTITGSDGTGAIVGTAKNTVLRNVYNGGTTVTDTKRDNRAGGLIGLAEGNITVDNSYSTGTVANGKGSGIIGSIKGEGTQTISNSYSTGTIRNGFLNTNYSDDDKLTIINSYTSADRATSDGKGSITNTIVIGTAEYGSSAKDVINYSDIIKKYGKPDYTTQKDASLKEIDGFYYGLTSVSNTGGVTIDANGNITRSVWRVYEGQALPILTSQLKGITTVNYDYSLRDNTGGNNGGKDVTTGLTYAAANVSADNVQYGGNYDGTGATVADNVRNAGTKALIYGDQDGWDIVGGTVTIAKKTVKFTGGNFSVDREYDGKTDATEAFQKALKNGGLKTGGIYAEDEKNGDLNYDKISASYNDKNVGDKTVTANGTLSFAAGSLNASNYAFENDGELDGLTGIKGKITPRTLYVTSNADGSIDKFYDGTSAANTPKLAAGKTDLFEFDKTADTSHQKVQGDNVDIDKTTSGNFYYVDGDKNEESNVVDGMSVKYTGLQLTGDDAKNYVLALKDTKTGTITTVANNTVYLAGTINRRTISKDDFKVLDKNGQASSISKGYDGSLDFTLADGMTLVNDTSIGIDDAQLDGKGIMAADKDKLKFILTGTGKFYAADGTTETADASDNTAGNAAKKVGYDVQVSADDKKLLNNYQIELTDADTAVLSKYEKGNQGNNSISVLGDGTITRRNLNIGQLKNITDVNKEYDGNTTVKSDALIFGTDIGYKDSSALVDSDGLTFVIKAEYDGKDVVRDTDGKAKENGKNIKISLGLEGDAAAAGNYIINNTAGETLAANTAAGNNLLAMGAGTGMITPRKLDAVFKRQDKTYDGTSSLLTKNTDITLTGHAGGSGRMDGDDLSVDYTNAYYADDTNTAAKNASTSGLANSATHIRYTGVSLTGASANNYDLADADYNGKGIINKKTLTKDDIQASLGKASKVYDATKGLENAGSYVTSVSVKGVAGDDLKDGLVVSGAEFADANSGNEREQDVTYSFTLNADKDVMKNYELDASAGGTLTATGKGTITKRNLTASIKNPTVEKVYDGKTTVRDAHGNVIQDDDAVTWEGWIDTSSDRTKNVTANYEDKNVAYVTDQDGNKTIADKKVNYVIKLDDVSAGNYNLIGTDGNAIANNTLTGTGRITPATLHVSFGDISKTYDGTTDVDPGKISSQFGTGDVKSNDSGVLDDVGLDDSQYDAHFNSANVKEADRVTYTIELTGKDKDNYVLDMTRNNARVENGKTLMDGKGAITTKKLTDQDVNIRFDTISKVYDTTNEVSYDHTNNPLFFDGENGKKDSGDYINGFTIGGVDLAKDTDYTITSAIYNSPNVDATEATYQFKLRGDALSNYDLSGLTNNLYDSTSNTLTLSTAATITPKKIQASLKDSFLNADSSYFEKVYDGTDKMAQDSLNKIGVDNIIQLDGVIHQNNDTTALDTDKIHARYEDKNVAYDYDADGKGTITNKDMLFDVALTGNGSQNYVINGTNTNSTTLTADKLGRITPKKLTAEFDKTERDYKGSNKADAEVTGVTLDGVAAGDTISLTNTDITGEFGYLDANGNFVADGNVNYEENAAGKAGFKDVRYSGLQQALENATGTKYGNYTIDDTKYYSEDKQKGRITRLQLNKDDIEAVWKDAVTKEYDGTSKVLDAENHFVIRTKNQIDGDYVEFKVSHDEDWANYYDAAGQNKQIDVTDNSKVIVKVNGLAADDILHNFDITGLTENAFQGTYETTGTITPRVLKVDLTNPNGWDKIYDGTNAIKDANGNVVNSFDYTLEEGHDIIERDKNTVNIAVTGAYDDANANIGSKADAVGGKGITYTITLTGSGAKNYKLEGATTAGDNTTTTKTGTGDIRRREVYVDYNDATGNPKLDGIDKTYDGTKDITNLSDYQQGFYTEKEQENTGILAKDTGVSLDTGAITGGYASSNVRYDGNNPTAQDVTFGNFTLTGGAAAKNYDVVVRRDKGSGTISPKTIKATVDNATLIRKDYDGTYNLGENDQEIAANLEAIKNGITLDNSALVNNDSINLTIANASYDKKDAGNNPTGLNYTLGWDNTNYRLDFEAADSAKDMQTDNITKNSAAISTRQGEITQRELTVGQWAKDAEKTYDGTTGIGGADAGKNLTFTNVIQGDTLNATADAEFDDANAANSETEDEKKHTVNYKNIAIGNSNYKLADPNATAQGNGVIHRAGLTVVADADKIRVSEPLPSYSGTVTGWYGTDGDAYKDSFVFDSPNADNMKPGRYGIYGWYTNQNGDTVMSGNVGNNYVLRQAPGNATALTVEAVDPGREYHDTVNPKGQFRPDFTSYDQASNDRVSGFNNSTKAALEYRDVNGAVLGTLTVDSGDADTTAGAGLLKEENRNRSANMDIAGAEIVNMDGADAAATASVRIDDSGNVVNLEIERG